jgi:SagB-type dehydrogenase family enzyme
MPSQSKALPTKSFALEALFTPKWCAIYDPVSRDRWDASALLDSGILDVLCADMMTPEHASKLAASGLVRCQPYSKDDAENWISAGWAEALRHYLHTNLLPKLDYGTARGWLEDFGTMREKLDSDALPPPTKRYADALCRLRLSADPVMQPLGAALSKTSPANGRRRTGFHELATLLIHVFGVSGHKSLAITGRHVTKTSPSGGSRHPTEAYVVVFSVEGLEEGVYHFDADSHELALLNAGDMQAEYLQNVLGLNRRLSFEPRVAIALTSVVERSMHRYRDSRSYRVLHFDLGHLLMSSQLVASSLGIPYLCAYSIADDAAEAMLGVDGLMETAMTQVLLG